MAVTFQRGIQVSQGSKDHVGTVDGLHLHLQIQSSLDLQDPQALDSQVQGVSQGSQA